MIERKKSFQRQVGRLWLVAMIVAGLVAGLGQGVQASTPLGVAGYFDFVYNPTRDPLIVKQITGEKPESKLWWNDGFWWGSLFNPAAGEYRIHRFNWGTQEWEDTGVTLDNRTDTKADVLWDGANNKLYVASHRYTDLGSTVNDAINRGKLFRYTYDPLTQTYTLDPGFPTDINRNRTETLVIAQELTDPDPTNPTDQRLWATYVSRTPPGTVYQVFVNYSEDGGATWGMPFVLPFPEADVAPSDISSIIAFGGNKIGVFWNNTATGAFYFATHTDGDLPDVWSGPEQVSVPGSVQPEDHINLKTTPDGRVIAAVKLNGLPPPAPPPSSTDPQIGLIVRDGPNDYKFHEYSNRGSNDTRPIVVVDESAAQAYMFVAGKPGGSKICYKSLDTSLLSDPSEPFVTSSFDPCGESFIEDSTYYLLDDPTSSKHNVNAQTGLVVLASDNFSDTNEYAYVHNVLGDPPPVVTSELPTRTTTGAPANSAIQVTFSKPMNLGTFDGSTFTVNDGTGPLSGAFAQDASGHVVTFQPDALLKASTVYTVQLTSGIQDTSANQLFERAAFASEPGVADRWSFTTAAPTVQFSIDSYSVLENGGAATITATLDLASSTVVTVNYATSDDTAVDGTDYTGVSGTLIFAPGQTVQTFAVPIIDNLTEDANRTLNLALSSPVNATLGTPANATLTIVDNEGPPTVQFTPASYTVNENAGAVTIIASLSHTSTSQITVDYATSDGTATGGLDYAAASGTLTFAPNVLSQSFDLTITDDEVFEADETINLALSNPINADLGIPGNTAVVTIVDNDATPVVQFSSATYSADEGNGVASITAVLDRPSAFPVTVDVATSDGTAQAPEDYAAASGTLTFAAGETSKSIDVAIVEDALDEPDELVNLVLSNATGATLGLQSTAVLTIVDNDNPPTVQFSGASYQVNENAGPATITVTLSSPSGKAVTAGVVTSDGTATAGSDYTPVSTTVSFDPGQTVQVLTVDVAADALVESDETVNLALTSPVNASLGDPSTTVLSILDQNELPRVRFTATAYQTTEDGNAIINVSLSSASVDQVTVQYATSDGTATAPGDYAATSGTLTFAPGVTTQSFTVLVNDDADDEENETVNLVLSNATGATLGVPNTAVLTIIDNDGVPTVQFTAASYSVNENGGTATIEVRLSNAAPDPVTVQYATSDGTAGAPSDYTATSGTLTFAPGETSQTFTVAVNDDAVDEEDETVILTLSAPVNATILGGQSTATLFILDNDGTPTVRFSAANYAMNEDSGTATIVVTLSHAGTDQVTVQYATSDGTATAPGDYTAASGTLTFAPGETSQTFTVTVTDDTADEADETVNLTLSNPVNATLGALSTATLTILDNDSVGGAQGPTLYLPVVHK